MYIYFKESCGSVPRSDPYTWSGAIGLIAIDYA